MDGPADSQIMNYVVRMVVPMRREFGRSLDVAQFMRDAAYRRQVLDEADGSQDARLREYASYVRSRLAGARSAHPPPAPASAKPAKPGAPAAPAEPAKPGEPTEEELRQRVMRKYTGGLR